MGAIVTLAIKDLRWVLRDRFALFWLFAFPLMYALFFGSIFGDDGDDGVRSRIPIALVDDDRSEGSARLVAYLGDHESLAVARIGEGEAAKVHLDTVESARDLVRRGRRVAYVRIPKGYGDAPFAMFGGADDTAGLEVGIDPSRGADTGMLRGILMQSQFEMLSGNFSDREGIRGSIEQAQDDIDAAEDLGDGQKLVLQNFMGALDEFLEDADLDLLEQGMGEMDGDKAVSVVEVTRERGNVPRSSFEITFPTAMIWGLMTAAMSFAVMIVKERTQGTLLRLKVAPLGRAQILAGKALGCFLMCQVVMAAVLGFGFVALGVRCASAPLTALAMACTGACFTGLMMTASVMGKTEQAVAGASWGAMMPFAMIGGGMIPLVAMPPWLRTLSDYSPFKWGIYAMEGVIWRGFDLSEMLAPCGILLAIGALFFGFGVWMFRRIDG